MDYTTSLHSFTNLVAQQLSDVAGRVPVYPGIGAFILETDGTLSQLQTARAADASGFILFELSPTSAATLLPAIGSGATAPDEPDTDNDLLPDSWELRWFGNLTTAGLGTNKDGDALSDQAEYIVGTDPTVSTPVPSLAVQSLGQQVRVTFEARGVDSPGYQNAARHYRLESSTSLGSTAEWSPVPEFSDHIAASGVAPVSCVLSPNPGGARYYRLRIWLEQSR
jgi:hypothetical protein